ncbi:MAG: ATP-binding protein [Chitinophagaceae bacterium]
MEQKKQLFGRQFESRQLMEHYNAPTSSMVAIVGRRRIGKTFLVRRTLEGLVDFEMTGVQNSNKKEQLNSFVYSLSNFTKSAMLTQPPKSWLEAFHLLKLYLEEKKGKKKKIIFIDELPWVATPKSGFMQALAHFWNDWASEHNALLIICGSAAAWMVNNVVNNKGGLHNRISQTIYLEPFTLNETWQLVKGMKIKGTYHQVIELYMSLGGVPYYLSLLQKGLSIPQNIDNLLFDKKGKLANEYENLFSSLFDNSSNHYEVVDILATKWKGLTRVEIAALYHGGDGGALTQILNELRLSGFISKYTAYQKASKDALYRLSDAYLLFYKKFLAKPSVKKSFLTAMKGAEYKTWCGYAFENVCLYHIPQIKQKLGIARIQSSESSFFFRGNKNTKGFQVDLLIDRADGIVNLCEIKFYNAAFTMDKAYYHAMKTRMELFSGISKIRKAVHLTLITSLGVFENDYSVELVDSEVTAEDLFVE